jgi:hypothetical protein
MCICSFIYEPVCACNGLVYSNSCLAQCDGNSIIGPVDPTLVPGQSCSLSSCEVTIIGDSMPCVFPYTLEALSSGSAPFTYNWTFAGTNTNAGSTSNLLTVPNYYSGGYCVSVTDVNGCVDSACINISALPMIVNSNPNPPIVCQGELLQLSVDDLSLTNVNWIWPLTSLSNPLNLYPNNDSCYFAEAIDANGCLRSGFICIEVDSCFSSINNVNVIGKHIKETYKNLNKSKKGLILKNNSQIIDLIKNNINNNDYLMIKGSNSTGLNKLTNDLKTSKTYAL